MSSCPIKWRDGSLFCLGCLTLALTATGFGQPPREPAPNLRGGYPLPGRSPVSVPDNGNTQNRGMMVVDVRIVGNRSMSKQRFFRHIKTRPGRPFDPERAQEDVLRLYKEDLVSGVRTLTQRTPQGLIVTFEVVERPIIGYLKFVGNRYYSDKHLSRQVTLKKGDALNLHAISDARRRLEEFYHSKGHPKTKVVVFEGDKMSDRGAVFYISEGRRERIWSVRFVGNSPNIASNSRLKTRVKSKPGFIKFFGGQANRQAIDEDVDRLIAYYRSLGFFQARVGRELDYDSSGKWLELTFVIDEGPRYKIRNVTVEGNTQFAVGDLLNRLELKSEQFFNLDMMNRDRSMLADLYGSQGFVYANINPDPRFLEEPGVIDLIYQVEEGQQYYVGKINIKIDGESPHTKKKVILDRLSFRTGELIDIRKVRNSERRIRRSQLFEYQPAQGISPSIAFSSPELSGQTAVARRPVPKDDRRYPRQPPMPGGVRR